MTKDSMQRFGEWAKNADTMRVGDPLNIELDDVVKERQDTLIQIRRLLLTMLRRARPDSPVHSMRDFPQRSPDSDN
jgi:hypothetical protein